MVPVGAQLATIVPSHSPKLHSSWQPNAAHPVPINCYGHDSQRLSNAILILSFNGEWIVNV